MCMIPMKINSRSSHGIKYSFIPCGKCAECRTSLKNAWFFRLAVELQECQKLNWHIGFFTLTYNDEHLPVYTAAEGHEVRCFRRSDVRRLILRLRKQYHKELGVTNLVYLIASEFGETTQRPHYHGVICFPPSIEPSRMLRDIKRFWSTPDNDNMQSLGFVFPSFEQYASEKFIVKSAYAAAMYAAKYCCKDIAFMRETSAMLDEEFKREEWKDCKQFHIQSKSLGSRLLVNMSDSDKMRLLSEGLQLVGSSRPLPIPLYIKNKILFDPYYMVDSKGNRIVARVASSFMRMHAHEIYDKKVDFYAKFFDSWRDSSYWLSLGLDSSVALRCSQVTACLLDFYSSARDAAAYYLSYYGIDPAKRSSDLVQSWLTRYFECSDFGRIDKRNTLNDTDKLFSYLFGCHNMQQKEVAYEKMMKVGIVQEYFKNNFSMIGY